jgi:hypothetical protein
MLETPTAASLLLLASGYTGSPLGRQRREGENVGKFGAAKIFVLLE